MLRILCVIAILALAAAPVMAVTASKDGTPVEVTDPREGNPSPVRADWEWSTAGMDFMPDLGGSSDGWGEWFITTAYNNSGQCLQLIEFGFPACGPPTGAQGWVVWTDLPGMVAPSGPASTADYYGTATWVCTDPEMWPPTIYTYVDVSAANVMIPANTYFSFGYDNTGMGGQTYYNGVDTWAWYSGYWDPDGGWGRTAVMQVKANYAGTTANEPSTWGNVKSLLR